MKVTTRILLFLLILTSNFAQSIDLRNPSQHYDYVVITKSAFIPLFDDFVLHKENVKSLQCAVASVDEIYSEFSDNKPKKEGIREFISYAGKNWPEPQPKYFFIAGDIDAIPNYKVLGVRDIDTVFTDYYYSVDVDSEDKEHIDYYVGRISARDSEELSSYLTKVISYESTPIEDWNNNVMVVGQDTEGTDELFKDRTRDFADNLFDYLKPDVFHSPSNFNAVELRNNIINGINIKGYSSVFIWGAESVNESFGDPLILDQSIIESINTDFYPFVSFLGRQKYSDDVSSSMLDGLLFNANGAIAGFNTIAPNFLNLMLEFYISYVELIYSSGGYSIAAAAVEVFNNDENNYLRKDLFGVFGDPSLSLKYDILASGGGEEQILYNFELSQNYPNPFNPTTSISFSIPETSIVELKVYDILGREVASILNEQMTKGNHKVEFSASQLSSGIYLYQLVAGNLSQTRKMILLK